MDDEEGRRINLGENNQTIGFWFSWILVEIRGMDYNLIGDNKEGGGPATLIFWIFILWGATSIMGSCLISTASSKDLSWSAKKKGPT